MGPTVCELEGPIPGENKLNMLIVMMAYSKRLLGLILRLIL